MRLESVQVLARPPVRYFQADDLADVVVLAGPNGVGKTRLIRAIIDRLRVGPGGGIEGVGATVAATSSAEREAWGKGTLSLDAADDAALLTQTLQENRRRRNWSSSIVNFESDRTIQNLQPLTFTWDMADPEEEEMSWDISFGFMRDRFQDTVHSMFRMIETQKQSIANRAVRLRRDGHSEMKLEFKDPMEPFKDVFAMLLAPKQLADLTARNQVLQYELEGQTFDFSTLSSGEREVVNIAFDFLLRRPSDCIVFFDEPELHLHPELSYKLLRTLRTIGERNQFILSTHSPDVITASLDQSVIFLSPDPTKGVGEPKNQAIAVSENDETNRALRLLGQSIGIVALGKRIVLIEGADSSLDKQTYGSIIGNQHPELVLVPSGGREALESFEHIYETVLDRTIWGVEFFMLCDRDSRPPDSSASAEAEGQSRLAVLPRYHVENYFLDAGVWAEAFAPLEPADAWLRQSEQIDLVLRELAGELLSYAAALSASRVLRRQVGNIDAMPKACHDKSLEQVQELIRSRAEVESARVQAALAPEQIDQVVAETYQRLDESLSNGDAWKSEIPGKVLVAKFANRAHVSPGRAKSMYLNAVRSSGRDTFAEIAAIFERFAA
jgi:predicted ATPase